MASIVAVLHGGPGAPGSVASLARALSTDFRVLEPLQRRSGGAPLSVDLHVADLAAVLPEPVALVGWSWGAMLGLSFAARHPSRVSALALVGCGTYDPDSRARYREAMARRMGERGRARVEALRREIDAATDPVERDRLFAQWADLATSAQAFDPLPDPEPPLPFDPVGHEETWRDAVRLQDEGIEPAAFAAIRCPVLMLHGEDDPHPGPSTRDVLRRLVPHLEYVSFPRCGHSPWLERHGREPFLRALREWLYRVP
jgi:pimeloyl-ACP methyl ester carboxylesterase